MRLADVEEPERSVEWFDATSGKVTGIGGVVVLALLAAWVLFDGVHRADLVVVSGCGLGAVLAWTALLRPRVGLTDSTLELRTMFGRTSIPLAAIEEYVVTVVLAVRAGGKRYTCPGVGRSRRDSHRARYRTPNPTGNYNDFVDERIGMKAKDARDLAGIRLHSDEQLALGTQVRRTWAWPEIGAMAVTTVALLLALLL